MMSCTITIVCLTVFYLCTCNAAPVVHQVSDSEAIILHSSSVFNPHKGSYAYSFDTSNGIKVKESGVQKKYREDSSDEEVGTVSRGSYSFTLPDCTIMTVNWVADENGFQPKITYSSTPTAIIPQEPTDEEATTTIIPF